MDTSLQTIIEFIQSNPDIPADQKEALLHTLKAASREMDILAFKLDRTEKVKRTTAILLEETIEELEQKRKAVEEALTELKATQEQLVQQEKLASLGQLTAGIAHEIKNPLNFVNNFSELSVELIEEVREEVKKSPFEGGSERSEQGDVNDTILDILNDIEANLRKIHEHGSRADGIVKSMLQHSRAGDGKMEPTNLNTLIKEYVNLSFHGMRACKNPINVDIEQDLDDSIGEVPLVADDFSRVVLNLCNNAFDAMRAKLTAAGDQPPAYHPKLTVRTKSEHGKVLIEIEDNGPGIPEQIKEKILQPFFTTKKGTEGTGLGLSISNDIIKAHGGEINVNSHEGEGCVFSITLPQKNSHETNSKTNNRSPQSL